MKKLIPLILCALLLFCACGESKDDGKITVVATMFPQYDFARNIAGDNASVELLLDFGADAHSYEPTLQDIIKISKADLFIYTGNEMELWVRDLLASADIKNAIDNGSLTVLDLSKHVELLPMHEHESEHEHTDFDTHIWTSQANAKAMCNAISDTLCALDNENSAAYTAANTAYTALLGELEESSREMTANAAKDTVYFGGSFAFRYWFFELGLGYSSIYEGCASHTEPSAKDLAKMIDEIKASGAKYVIYDTASEKKIADAIAKECGAEVLHLHAIHNISKAEFDAGEDYLTLMHKNVETLRKALS